MVTPVRRKGVGVAAILLALLVGPLASRPATPVKYIALEPFELVLMADVIVDGTILDCDAPRASLGSQAVFTLRVEAVIAGEVEGETIRVLEFGDWTCAMRYAPYETGQRALFHLQRQRDEEGLLIPGAPFRGIGSGNEGECPILDDVVFHRAQGWKHAYRKYHSVFGHQFYGITSDRAEYLAAITPLRECYEWDRESPDRRPRYALGDLQQLCSDAKLAEFEASSDVAKRFMTGVRAYQERAGR